MATAGGRLGRDPYGYHWADKRTLVPHETQATIYAEMYQMTLAGALPGEICRRSGLSRSAVHRLLRSRLPLGEYVSRTEGRVITHTDHHPAIVSRDTWEQVQAILPSRYRGPRGRYRRTPLSGLLRCGECGSVMRVINTRDPIGYGCRACRAIGSVSVRGWQTAILREVLAYLAGPALEPLCREIAAAYDSGHARGSAEASLARLRRSEARLIEAIADPDAGEVAALAVRLRETQGEIRAAEAALGALPAAITAESVRERIEGLIARLPAIGERAEAAPILAELIERIDVPADRSELRITVAPRVRLAPIPTPCAGRRVVRVRLPVAA